LVGHLILAIEHRGEPVAVRVSVELITRVDGGADQLPCGSRKSIDGGPNRSKASYVLTVVFPRSMVHSRPLKRCLNGADVSCSNFL
jgi:hypothetical protein